MGKLQTPEATSSPIVAFHFSLANLAVSQTDTAVPIPGAVTERYAMPKGGYIVGYSAHLTAAITAGSLDIDITINTTSTKTIAIDTAATTEFGDTVEVPNEPFSALDTLGVDYTSDASLAPVTSDLVVTVFVMFEDFTV